MQLTIERFGTCGVTSAPTPSRSTHCASPPPRTAKVARIVASIRSSVSTSASLVSDSGHYSAHGVIGVLTLHAVDRLADQPPCEGNGGAVAAYVHADAQPVRPAYLEPGGHLSFWLEAAHEAATR